jgi:spore coat polysaccharide biosynthesis predicted glycosyltransferase SpsG/RimJ/RimL family protein N-acetyltransferase
MVIDDLADRAHDCDLLLDQNLVAEMSTRYAGKVSPSCVLLLGPEYALLHQDYAALHGRLPPREGQIRNILISFGAADSMNLTGKTLMAFLSLNRPDIEAHVVISNGSHHCQTIREQAAGHRNVHVHYGVPTLAPLMAKADLAVGASGVTSWERLCLGLPALVITLAENQRPIAERLAQRGMIEWLGHQDKIDELVIARALGKVLEKGLEAEWSLRCRELVDGQGGNRVCELLIADEKTSLRGRHAILTDEAILLKWANDPLTRQNAFLMDSISPDVHRRWFWSRLRDIDGCRLYIIETVGGLAIGQVRFDSKEDTWVVDYSLAPEFRGRGLGSRLLEIGLANLRASIQLTPVILGKVKSANYPSRRVFEKLGFRSQILGDGVLEYRRVL